MSKFLIQATYTADGLQGLIKQKATSRRAVVQKAIEGLGGKLEAIYYSFGEHDVIVLADLPDTIAAASLSLHVGASGLVRIKTTPLLTIQEVDQALQGTVDYRPPGA